jgi:hypothetical protein
MYFPGGFPLYELEGEGRVIRKSHQVGAVSLASMFGFSILAAPAASAANCGAAVCMYKNANSGVFVATGAYGVCGYYSNLQNQGANDMISSVDNWVNHSQYFYKNAGANTWVLTVYPYAYVANLAGTAAQDSISSVVWIG